ncbi:unnamed protein product [Effrenium voratum]|uniref:Uncharacterized protein n=2 Tax=Effrenium voratum TaxID=2562239 RepID=A0AA36IFY5_9DINO|nr:unnamed protein product [Effrenium voratum]CAJ1453530.1 unnamed protein product [Effrenium voratum]
MERRRAAAALRQLGEGARRAQRATEALALLQQELAATECRLGVDLRQVQESTVEHAAMYAKNPEVLGGMLQLVFCLDLVHQWEQSTDHQIKDLQAQLQSISAEFLQCRGMMEKLSREVQALRATDTETQELRELRRANAALTQQLARPGTGESACVALLGSLEELEPLLAAMPMESSRFLELQEEACEAYGRLRSVLLEAAAQSANL